MVPVRQRHLWGHWRRLIGAGPWVPVPACGALRRDLETMQVVALLSYALEHLEHQCCQIQGLSVV